MDNSTEESVSQILNSEFVHKTLPCQVVLGILAIFGTFGNISVVYIFMIHFKKTVFRIFVVSLAFVDTLICCFVIPVDIYMMRLEFVFTANHICRTLTSVKMLLVSTSVLLLFCLSIDRCRHVCHPLKSQLTTKIGKVLVAGSFVAAFLVTIPTFVLMHSTRGSCAIPTTDIMKLKSMITIVFTVLGLTIIYITIAVHISRQRIRRRTILMEISSISSKANGTVRKKTKINKGTKIALTICASFIISYTPSSLIVYFIKSLFDNRSDWYAVLYCFSRSYVLNSVVNPIIYGFWDLKFRTQIRRYLCSRYIDSDNKEIHQGSESS